MSSSNGLVGYANGVPASAPGAAKLRELMLLDGPVMIGQAFDCISAAVMAEAGYASISVSGAGVSASRLGLPDLGLVTLPDMVEATRRIHALINRPLVVDIDTGFGGPLNTARTIEEMIHAGAAAVHIEDQVAMKRCGQMSGIKVLPTEDYLQKVRAAVAARGGSDLVLIARVDAAADTGIDDAIDRGKRALEAGADLTQFEGLDGQADFERIAAEVPGAKMFAFCAGGVHSQRWANFELLNEMGFKLLMIASLGLYPAIEAMRAMAGTVLNAADDSALDACGYGPATVFKLVGLDRWVEMADGFETDPTPLDGGARA